MNCLSSLRIFSSFHRVRNQVQNDIFCRTKIYRHCKKLSPFHVRFLSSTSSLNGVSTEEPPEIDVAVDRRGLLKSTQHDITEEMFASTTTLGRAMLDRIRYHGPTPLSEYIRQCLTHPKHGFYNQKNSIFGADGHFITSPEITSLFGESLGFWVVSTCIAMKKKFNISEDNPLYLVELGPGRGTLMSDILRVCRQFPDIYNSLSIHLVEVSPALRKIQKNTLNVKLRDPVKLVNEHIEPMISKLENEISGLKKEQGREKLKDKLLMLKQMKTSLEKEHECIPLSQMDGEIKNYQAKDPLIRMDAKGSILPSSDSDTSELDVSWHWMFEDIPNDAPLLVVANEFFDCFPVHQFVKLPDRGWCEKLVDINKDFIPSNSDDIQKEINLENLPLRLIASHSHSTSTYLKMIKDLPQDYDAVEISPESISLMETITRRISKHGGSALIIDYGTDHPQKSSVQSLKNHKYEHILASPGEADITALVDFSSLRTAVEHLKLTNMIAYPLITQRTLLRELGIAPRLMDAAKLMTEDEADKSLECVERIVDEEGMGTEFKALCVAHNDIGTPIAFPRVYNMST